MLSNAFIPKVVLRELIRVSLWKQKRGMQHSKIQREFGQEEYYSISNNV